MGEDADQTAGASTSNLLDIDGREFGYCKVFEKAHMPADGSVILRTSLQRGISEAFPRPIEGTSEIGKECTFVGGEDFDPTPYHETRFARIIKDGLSFSIVTEASWAEYAATLRNTRLAAEQAEAEKRAAAEAERVEAERLRVAQGLPPDDGTVEAACDDDSGRHSAATDGQVVMAASEKRLEDLKFGFFSLSFPDGARCHIRMQHERRWYEEGQKVYDTIISRPGVEFTYTPVSGVLLQVFSNGAVRQTWPQQLLGGRYGVALSSLGMTAGDMPPRPAGLGGPDDLELARIVTPFGVLIRELLSGRREFYFPSGLRAVRNPTPSELAEQRQRLQREGFNPAALRSLDRFAETLEGLQVDQGPRLADLQPPLGTTKATGLSGHWRIIQPDGRVLGRVPVPRTFKADFKEETVPDAVADAADETVPDADIGEAQPPQEEQMPPEVILQELLKGYLVDSGETIEYEIDQASVTLLTDPHTGQEMSIGTDGVLTYKTVQDKVTTSILPDGTHIIHTIQKEGHEVIFEKECAPRVTCTINDKAAVGTRCTFLYIDCDDGTQLKVTPQNLNLVGELNPADPTVGDPETLSTNASVAVHRREGTVVTSKGSGEVDVISSFALAGGNLGATLDRGMVFTAHLDEDRISIRDRSQNLFEVLGDQTVRVKLAVSMGDDFKSPRCTKPGQPYKHPDAEFLPVPERAPEPRLFAVYGDGDAEELLLTRDAHELLRLARADEQTTVLEERMGPPMEVCRSHTLLRAASSEPATVPLRPLDVPPIVEGFQGLSALDTMRLPLGSSEFTAFRQLVEHPPTDDAKHKAFLAALAAESEREDKHRLLHRPSGEGHRSQSRGSHVIDATQRAKHERPGAGYAGGGGA
jgi:hypothetical protein